MRLSLIFIIFVSFLTVSNGYAANKSFENILELSEKGASQAQFKVGVIYESGQPILDMLPSELIEQNYEKAIFWYKKSAEPGNVKALTNLGRMYEDGEGVKQDFKKAREWYEKAIKSEKVDGFEEEDALYRLATLHYRGLGGPQNFKVALNLYKKAVLHSDAQLMVAYMYYKGEGVSGKNFYFIYIYCYIFSHKCRI